VIGDVDSLGQWLESDAVCSPQTAPRPFHLEIDTGMSRAGIRWDDHAALQRASALLADAPGWEGVFSHFHSAESDAGATDLQWDRFLDALHWFPRRPEFVHIANSAGALRNKAFAGDLVRPGIYLYGGSVGEWAPAPRAVAKLQARVVGLRQLAIGDTVSYNGTWRADVPSSVATVSCGYADGLLRAGSNRLRVEVNGKVVSVVGRITMDMTMLDVTGVEGCEVGTVVTLIGRDGADCISVDEVAALAGLSPYEVLVGLRLRLPRRYRYSEGNFRDDRSTWL
jgi:alanine racemase